MLFKRRRATPPLSTSTAAHCSIPVTGASHHYRGYAADIFCLAPSSLSQGALLGPSYRRHSQAHVSTRFARRGSTYGAASFPPPANGDCVFTFVVGRELRLLHLLPREAALRELLGPIPELHPCLQKRTYSGLMRTMGNRWC